MVASKYLKYCKVELETLANSKETFLLTLECLEMSTLKKCSLGKNFCPDLK